MTKFKVKTPTGTFMRTIAAIMTLLHGVRRHETDRKNNTIQVCLTPEEAIKLVESGYELEVTK